MGDICRLNCVVIFPFPILHYLYIYFNLDTMGSNTNSISLEELSKKNFNSTPCQDTFRKYVVSDPSTRLFHDSDEDIDYESAGVGNCFLVSQSILISKI